MLFKLNPDREYVMRIREVLLKKGGYCPCRTQKIPANICPCVEFVDTGICHCGMFEEVKENKN